MVVSRRSILYPVTYSGTTNTFALHEVSLYKNETAKYIANELSMLHSLYSTPMPIKPACFSFFSFIASPAFLPTNMPYRNQLILDSSQMKADTRWARTNENA